jgi:hypothetical protein
MELLQFNDSGVCVGTSPFGTHASPDPDSTPFRWKLDDDGTVVDAFPGIDDEDIMEAYNASIVLDSIERLKKEKIKKVKEAAAGYIQELQWKVDRALERDLLNGTSTVNEIYAIKEDIRQASNAVELLISQADSEEAVNQISHSRWWPAQ